METKKHMTKEEVIEAAKLYAERFTKEWMASQSDSWYWEANDWFFNEYLRKEESGYTILDSWFRDAISELWRDKWNQYFGEDDDYYTLISVKHDLESRVIEPLAEVKKHGHFDISQSAIDDLKGYVDAIQEFINKYKVKILTK